MRDETFATESILDSTDERLLLLSRCSANAHKHVKFIHLDFSVTVGKRISSIARY